MSITVLRWTVADCMIDVIVGKVVGKLKINGLKQDFLQLKIDSFDNIGKTVVRLDSLHDPER